MTQICTSGLTYNKAIKLLIGSLTGVGLSMGNFPKVLTVKSHVTGKVLTFVQDNQAAEINEGWGGEQMQYLSKQGTPLHPSLKLILSAC